MSNCVSFGFISLCFSLDFKGQIYFLLAFLTKSPQAFTLFFFFFLLR